MSKLAIREYFPSANNAFKFAVASGLANSFLWFGGDKLMGGMQAFSRTQLFISPKDKHRFREMFNSAEEAVKQ